MDEDSTPAEIDVLFAATQPIGDAIRALGEAGLAATAESKAETAARLGRIVQAIMDAAGRQISC